MTNTSGKISWYSAAALVVANMIGTGVFTTLGLQLQYTQSSWTILLLWVFGGLMALCGAFTYAEIGSRLPKSGGEYYYLSRIYHPFIGYLSGWVSLTVGFAAAIALAAMAAGDYMSTRFDISSRTIALLAIVSITLVHSFSLRHSSRFQNISTLLKIGLVLFIIIACFWPAADPAALPWTGAWRTELFTSAAAISLIYVSYTFSGWNAAAYITDEIESPRRNLPRALIGGTLLVTLLFIFLQLGFLRQAPPELLRYKVEVGQVVAERLFGAHGGNLISILIALLLVASISAMVWVGPRVTRAMATDYRIWGFFAQDNRNQVPVRAIWLQTGISMVLVWTSSFEQVLIYSGFVLQLFTTLTVIGLFRLRRQNVGTATAYISPLFPWLQLIFLAFSGWILVYLLIDKPVESLLGFLNLLAGAGSYFWNKYFFRPVKPGAVRTEGPAANKVETNHMVGSLQSTQE